MPGTENNEHDVSSLTFSDRGDLKYPIAKRLSILLPVSTQIQKQEQHNNSDDDDDDDNNNNNNDSKQRRHSRSLDDTANRIYMKEVLSITAKESYYSSFDNLYMSNHSTTCGTSSIFYVDMLRNLIEKEEKEGNNKKDSNKVVVKNKNSNNKSNSDDGVAVAVADDYSAAICNNDSSSRNVVHFSNVTIQEYPIQPGDNPGGNTGCPLTIGWDVIGLPVTVPLDKYEKFRYCDDSIHCRRPSSQLILVSSHREHILRQLGYSNKSINAGTKAANQTRRNRYQTIARLKSSKYEEFLEVIRKNVHILITCGQKKRRERKYLEPYLPSSSSSSFTSSTINGSYASLSSLNDESDTTRDFSNKNNNNNFREGLDRFSKDKNNNNNNNNNNNHMVKSE